MLSHLRNPSQFSSNYEPVDTIGTSSRPKPRENSHEHSRSTTITSNHSRPLSQISLHRPPLLMVNPDSRITWVHCCLGAASLLGWNALITATPYFVSRLRDSPFESTFSSYLNISLTTSGFGFLAHATLTSKQSPSFFRIRYATLWLMALTFLLIISTFVPVPPTPFFLFVILNAILQSAATSYLSTAIIALATLFGPLAVQSVMLGQGLIGIVLSAVQVVSVVVSIDKVDLVPAMARPHRTGIEKSATAFFLFATIFLVICLFAHAWLVRMPIYRAVVVPFEAGKLTEIEEEEESERERLMGSMSDSFNEIEPIVEVDILSVTKMNWKYNTAVAYVFIITLAVFPPITTSISSVNSLDSSILSNPLLFNVLHFLTFNVGDYLGRFVCAFPAFQCWKGTKLLIMSLARTAFIPLFLGCNVLRPGEKGLQPPLINSDLAYMLILLCFGVTNGHVSSLCMMSAGSLEHNKRLRREQMDVAAIIAQFCLNGGLLIGSIVSFAVRARVCDCNPFYG